LRRLDGKDGSMKWLVIEPHRLISCDGDPTQTVIEKLLEAPPRRTTLSGPGYLRAHWDDDGARKMLEPNMLATLFLREHGHAEGAGVIQGTMVLTGGDWAGGGDDVPDWVEGALVALIPRAKAIYDAADAPN
jgi:hypothetical protein